MGIDASIYQNLKTPEPINVADVYGKALSLSQMSLQNQQAQMQMQQQADMRSAYARNTDQNGNLNRQGVLSDLGRINPQQRMAVENDFAKNDKLQADAQNAHLEALSKTTSQVLPSMHYLAGLPEDQRAKAYPATMQQLEAAGAPMKNVPKDADGNYIYDPGFFKQTYGVLKNTDNYLKQQEQQAGIAKTWSDVGQAPAKLNSELYGARSPNAELTSQYDKAVAPIRSSQGFMQQMLDSHANKTPQGDAALVLANFKIRNPQAVDVNSLEEMKNSQSVSDAWKNKMNEALNGGFDDQTRDNLLRDGASAYRANMQTYSGIKQRYQTRQTQQNVNDPSLTYEPALLSTNDEMNEKLSKIGKYVPPSDRGGFMAGVNGLVGKITGVTGGNQSAIASDDAAKAAKEASKYRPQGATVSGDEVAQYATKHGMKLSDAQAYLKGRGYAIGR